MNRMPMRYVLVLAIAACLLVWNLALYLGHKPWTSPW